MTLDSIIAVKEENIVQMAAEPSTVVREILKYVDETQKLVKDAVIVRDEFMILAQHLSELRPPLKYLQQDLEILALQGPALDQIADILESIFLFTERCVTGSRIYLLYHYNDLVDQIRNFVVELKASLQLFSPMTSEVFMSFLENARTVLEDALFQPNPGHEELSQAIAVGLAHNQDELSATLLLQQIASHLQLPLSTAGGLRTELQEALRRAEAESRMDEVQELQRLCDLLRQATVLAEVKEIVEADFPFPESSSTSIPSAFFCPITGEIMKDPVMVVEAGYTYEKAAILEWFNRGHSTCPDTGSELDSLELLDNHNLRQAIQEFFDRSAKKKLEEAVKFLLSEGSAPKKHGSGAIIKKYEVPVALSKKYEATVAVIKDQIDSYPHHKSFFVKINGLEALVSVLRPASQAVRDKVLRILSKVTAGKDRFKARLVKAGVVPLLVRLLTKTPTQTSGVMQLLWEVSQVDPGKKAILEVKGSIFPIASAFSSCTLDQKDMAEKLLDNLCQRNPDTVLDLAKAGVFKPLITHMSLGCDIDTRVLMARAVVDLKLTEPSSVTLVNSGVIAPLLDLLQGETVYAQITSLKALRHLSEHHKNRLAMAKMGVIPVLVRSLVINANKVRIEALGTLANLSADRHGSFEIDHDGHVTTRLLGMVRYEDSEVQEGAIETLVCMAKNSRMVRVAIKDSGDVPFLLTILQRQAIGRVGILCILCCLAEDSDCRDCVIVDCEVLQFFTKLLEKPARLEEKQLVVGIMSGIASLPESKALMIQESSLLSALIRCLEPRGSGSERVQESAAGALSRLVTTAPVDIDMQLLLAKLGMMPLLVDLLNSKDDKTGLFAATTLGVLSKSTPQLIVQQSGSKKLLARFGVQRYKSCKVHAGQCSQKGTLCLVVSGAVPLLVKHIKEGGFGIAESAIDALFTLVDPKECKERGVEFLVKHNVIEAAVSLVGRNPSLTEKGVCMLEQIFSIKKYQDDKFSHGAKSSLYTTLTTGTLEAKKASARALGHLGIMPQSSTFSFSL